MANSIVGYTPDVLDGIITYNGGETDTAIVSVDNVEYKIYATVKDGALTKLVANDNSIAIVQTDTDKRLNVKISPNAGNRLELKSNGLYAAGPSEADIDNIRHEILGLQEDVIQDGRHINEVESKLEVLKGKIPTKTSQLVNDAHFVTNEELSENYATIEYVDTKLGESGFITTKFVNSITDVKHENILYFVKRGGTANDVYDEYMLTSEHKAERIGGLSKDEVLGLITSAIAAKQDKLIAGSNIKIEGNVISVDGISLPFKSVDYDEFDIIDNELHIDEDLLHSINDVPNIQRDLITAQIHIKENAGEIGALKESKQDKLIPGAHIKLENNKISAEVIDSYAKLKDIPKINNVELKDNVSLSSLGAQDKLQSGINIKTINGQSLLGSGDIEISAGDGTVKSVNGVEPDQDGNVELQIPSLDGYRTALEQDVIDATKQEKLTAGENIEIKRDESGDLVISAAGGPEGTVDYNVLINKPTINGVQLLGDKSLSDLGIDIPDISNKADKSYVDEQIAAVEAEIPSIDNLATKEELNAVENKIPSITNLATKEELQQVEDKIPSDSVTHAELQAVENKIPSIEGLVTEQKLQSELVKKQNNLTAGANITISGNTISAKDTVYTAGENITIENNVISAVCNSKLDETITVTETIGNYKPGDVIEEGTDLLSIIKNMLVKEIPPVTSVQVYLGGSDMEPTSVDELSMEEIEIEELMSDQGLKRTIVCGNVETEEGQFATIAVPKEYELESMVVTAAPIFPLNYKTVRTETHNIYYNTPESYDEPDGINYTFKFKKVN